MILCDLCWEFTWRQVLQSYSVRVRVRAPVRVRFAEEGADRHLARQSARRRGVGFFQLLQGKKWTARNRACTRACLVAQSRLTLCNPMDCSPPSSSVRGILQARTLEWVTVPSSRGSFWLRDQTHTSCVSWIAGGFFTRWAIRAV